MGTLSLSRYLQSRLYRVEGSDPVVLLSVLIVVSAAAGLGVLVPAFRAARVDPQECLRSD